MKMLIALEEVFVAAKSQMTGMLGVYLTAAELTRQGMIVSVTSRSAKGVDLLATDQFCKKAWSIQVKANSKPSLFWLLHPGYKGDVSDNHVYVFVNLRGESRADFWVVPSKFVAAKGRRVVNTTGTVWHSFRHADALGSHREGWSIFLPP